MCGGLWWQVDSVSHWMRIQMMPHHFFWMLLKYLPSLASLIDGNCCVLLLWQKIFSTKMVVRCWLILHERSGPNWDKDCKRLVERRKLQCGTRWSREAMQKEKRLQRRHLRSFFCSFLQQRCCCPWSKIYLYTKVEGGGMRGHNL